MSSAYRWEISNESSIVNWFKLRSKVSVANSNLLRFGTFGHLPLISFYDTLAKYPKLRFCSLGCLGRISFYYTLAIQELKLLPTNMYAYSAFRLKNQTHCNAPRVITPSSIYMYFQLQVLELLV